MRSNQKILEFQESVSTRERLRLSLLLAAGIWLLAGLGQFTPLAEWPALALYVLGGIGLVVWYGNKSGQWQEVYLAGGDLKRSLFWGGIIGGGLFVMDIGMTFMAYEMKAGDSMAQMERILVDMKMLYFFPILILAEEFLWRGILFSALIDKGLNKYLVIAITTFLYMINHIAVAPVAMMERMLMAMMALPIGVIGGFIVLKTRNVWGSVLLHMVTMIAMILDIFLVPMFFE
jgi:membrane protease YdiL (CAAX protease family)